MDILAELARRHASHDGPFLIDGAREIRFRDILRADDIDLSTVAPGDVVALIGDFDPLSVKTLLHLFDRRAIVVPLTVDTRQEHDYFFATAKVDVVIEGASLARRRARQAKNPALDDLRRRHLPGLIVFSSGTTGRPKAILHNVRDLLMRYEVPRQALRTMNFLFFDHLGGINTLFHTLFNRGVVVNPSKRTPHCILQDIERHDVALLPTTPTFLRMMLMSGLLDDGFPPCLTLVTYGAERMDPSTLTDLVALCPNVDFRQTYGSSEIGVLKIVSRAKDSLWMKICGDGVETKVVDGVLKIRSSANRMMAYLDAPSPFDEEGWFDSQDLVEVDGDWIRIVGRTNQVINVGGLKILPEEIERRALEHEAVLHADAKGVANPITGQHIALTCQLKDGAALDKKALKTFLGARLPPTHMPHRIVLRDVAISHRFKKQ